MVHLAPGASASDAHRALLRVDPDAPDACKVYDQPVVGDAQAPAVVPAAPDGKEHVVLAGEVHAGDHVGGVDAARHHARSLVDHGVVDLAGLVVPRIAGPEEFPAQARPELR